MKTIKVTNETALSQRNVRNDPNKNIITAEPNKTVKVTKKEPVFKYTLITEDDIKTNIIKSIVDQLKDQPVVIEPDVYSKIMFMMNATGGHLEVYGKLITEIEEFASIKYACVKDVLVPYQNVTSASFESTPEQMAKWMNEINRYEDGSLKPLDEVNNITKRMLGHWHSHEGAGSCSPSPADTEDMIEHVNKRKFWIEIITTRSQMSARISVCDPFNIIISRPVLIKWWTLAESVLKNMKEKVYRKEYEVPPQIKNKGKNKKEKEIKCPDCDTTEHGDYCIHCKYDYDNKTKHYDDDDEELEYYLYRLCNNAGISEG